jgi:hypothetical protein
VRLVPIELPRHNASLRTVVSLQRYVRYVRHVMTDSRRFKSVLAPTIFAVRNQFQHRICGKRCRVPDLCIHKNIQCRTHDEEFYGLIFVVLLHVLLQISREVRGVTAPLAASESAKKLIRAFLSRFGNSGSRNTFSINGII